MRGQCILPWAIAAFLAVASFNCALVPAAPASLSPRQLKLMEWVSQKRVADKLPLTSMNVLPSKLWRDHAVIGALTSNSSRALGRGDELVKIPLSWGLNEVTVRATQFGDDIAAPLEKMIRSGKLRLVDRVSYMAVLGLMHAASTDSSPWYHLTQSLPHKYSDLPLLWGAKNFREMANAGFPEFRGELELFQSAMKEDWAILSKNKELQRAFQVQPLLFYSEKYFTWAIASLWKYDLSVIADVPFPTAMQHNSRRNPRAPATPVSAGVWKLGELGIVPVVHYINYCNWPHAASAETSFAASQSLKDSDFRPFAYQDMSEIESFLKDRTAQLKTFSISSSGEVTAQTTAGAPSVRQKPNALIKVLGKSVLDEAATLEEYIHNGVVVAEAQRLIEGGDEVCVLLPKPLSAVKLLAYHGFLFVDGPFYLELSGNIDNEDLQDFVATECDGCLESAKYIEMKRDMLAMAGMRAFNAHRLWGDVVRNTSAPEMNLLTPVYQPEVVLLGGGYLPQELIDFLMPSLQDTERRLEKEGANPVDEEDDDDEEEEAEGTKDAKDPEEEEYDEESKRQKELEKELQAATVGDVRWYFPRRGVRYPPGLSSLFMLLRTMLLSEEEADALAKDLEAKLNELGGSLERQEWDRIALSWRQHTLQALLLQHGTLNDRTVSRIAREWILENIRFPSTLNINALESAGAKFHRAKGIDKVRVRLTQRRLKLYRAAKAVFRKAEKEAKGSYNPKLAGSNTISSVQ